MGHSDDDDTGETRDAGEESELLDVLKEILVENLELLDDSERAQKENYLRRQVDGRPCAAFRILGWTRS